ncbi:hypothetical protein [Halanaerobacter jeridensis]|uniref:Uncharacterized protein n=1 Tax=Halanaerobacter jeridensis TaxID=706427 RepID=A0A938XQW6_9FIRM|nr:hypothetical protein [Halanaerobacter jeridensis]MBM7555708.1 hypothetical protein [Halanaerobacter jeridensis]
MAVQDFLDFRKSKTDKNKRYQSELNIARIKEDSDRLENDLESFFEITYPSQLIKELIEFINSNMKNNKMRYRDNEGAIIIQGAHASGKTHALLTAYNLFANYDIVASWMEEHKIKFNAFAIKNKSKSCIVSLENEAEEKSWQVIFKKLGKENLLTDDKKAPSASIIKKLAKSKDTAIFIDDSDEFFHQLRQQNKDELIVANKKFIVDLLTEVNKNDNLMVFMAALGTAKEIKDLFSRHEVIIKETEFLAQKNSFIFYHLFADIQEQQFRTNIVPIIDSYVEKYEESGLAIQDVDDFREELIDYYPFQPKLLEFLNKIHERYFSEIQSYGHQLNLLADLIESHEDKDLLVVSDFPVEIFKERVPELYNGLKVELKRANEQGKKYLHQILNTIFLYNLIDEQEATRDSILKAVIHPQLDYEISSLQQGLDELGENADYVEVVEGRYYIKAKKSLDTLLAEEMAEITKEEKKNKLKEYISNSVFDSSYKFYDERDWKDEAELDYVLLLEAPAEIRQLENFLTEEIYGELHYENSVAIIKATTDIFSEQFLDLSAKVIAIQNITEGQGVNKNQLEERKEEEEKQLIELLQDSFGQYLQWGDEAGQLKLEKVDFDLRTVAAKQEIIIDKRRIKDYILASTSESIDLEQLFEEAKCDRRLPLIPTQEILEEVITELVAEKDFVFISEEDKLYKSLSTLIAKRAEEIDNTQARNKLLAHLEQDLFGPEYKIYAKDTIPDQAELQYLIIINDLVKGELRTFLEEEIYANRKYKNSVLLFKSTTDILGDENLSQVKEEMSLENLVKTWEQRERVIDLLEAKREKIINNLRESFGNYISWTSNGEQLIMEQTQLDIPEFNINNLIKTKIGFIKETVIKRINQLHDSIKASNLLLKFKENRSNPVIDRDTFYQVLEELTAEGRIYFDGQTEHIYSQSLISIKEEIEQLNTEEVKENLAYFIRDNLFDAGYKIWGYDQIEDSADLDYLLLLEQPNESIVDFLNQEIYAEREFQNSVIVLRVKEKIYTSEILDRAKKIIAVNNLEEQNEIENSQEFLGNNKEKLINLLADKFAYYEQWSSSDDKLELDEKEVSLANLDSQLEADFNHLKEHLIFNLRERKFGINIEELFLDYRRFRDYPLIIEKEIFDRAVEELIAEHKIINAEKENEVYGNTSALIKSTISGISDKEVKQELVLYIRNELFNGVCNVFAYDEIEDSPEIKYLLLLGSFKNKEKLQEILEEKLYQDREYKNNIILYSSQENVFEDKYINKMRLVMGYK